MANKIKRYQLLSKTVNPAYMLFYAALVLSLLFSGEAASASGGWQWQFNLTSPDKKVPFQMLTTLFLDSENNRFYVVEAGGNSLHSFEFDGKYISTFGPEGVLLQPSDMTKETGSGVLWVIEKGRNSLTRIDLKAKKVEPQNLEYKGAAVYPSTLAVDNDKFYLLDKSTGSIVIYNKELEPLKAYKSSKGDGGFVDFVVGENNIWALDAENRKIYNFKINSNLSGEISLSGYDFSFPIALEVGPGGFLYVLDKHRGAVAVFDKEGEYKYSFFQKGHDKNSLYYPEDMVFDPKGRLCIVDSGNGRVGVFSR